MKLLTRLAVSAPLLLVTSCGLFRVEPEEYDPVVLESGVVIHDLAVPPGGRQAGPGDLVAIDYVLTLDDGSPVDSSEERGRPYRFELGADEALPGLELGVMGMRLFGRRRIYVPAELGYGSEGLEPLIPPDAALRFQVELMELEPAEPDGGAAPQP